MIILLCGKKRVGKDTVADYLCVKYGFVKYSFADPMKRACKEIFMFTDEQLWGKKKEVIDPRLGITPRRILQVFGTELMRHDIHKHIPELLKAIPLNTLWIQRFKWWYENNKDKNIIISDGRFINELEIIKEMGGILIMIHRESVEEQNKSNHASEKEQEKMDDSISLVIYNDYSFKVLYNQIDNIYDYIYKRKWEI